MKLGELCEIVRGSSPRPKGDTRFYGGFIPRLMVADVTRDGKYVTPRINFLNQEGAALSRPMKKGDLVIALSGNPGLASILETDDFSEVNKQPTIAVSVDMFDTGVDVPEVVNLVFFKPVYSAVKFNQMIGRGTRLCKNLFGIGSDKAEFLVFDLCGNFDYFQQQLPEKELKPSQSISTQLVKTRLKLSNAFNKNGGEYKALQKNLLDDLHQHVESMERDNFLIRPHLQRVSEFSQRTRWSQVSNDDIEVINQLAELPNGLPTENEVAKRFDLLCLKLQLALLNRTSNYTALCD
jgi:type I restriction enzyme, R subunit